MDLLSKTTLASIMWLTILMGKPFALQYAQKDAPKERWGDQKFIQGCHFISLTWAYLMSISVGLRREAKGQFKQGLPNKANPWRRIEVKGRSGVTHWRYIIGITLRPTQIRQNRSISIDYLM
jgi:cytochrome bd-type quinol oxidase subunit 2